ncbi:MAG: YitT family protein [Bacteroidales bacterium]|nr:YitT family protein [Bacteroidales bacterium]
MQIFKKGKNIAISYVVITLGLLLYTFGWSAFMLPAQIVGGGVSGMSAILSLLGRDLFGFELPIGVLNLVFNGILVAIGFKVLGSKFGANTIYGIIMSSVFFVMWQQGLHVGGEFDAEQGRYINTLFDVERFGVFMCAVIGGACCGAGIGLSFIMGGNTGGTDIIALIVSKYHNVSPGRVIMIIDVVIVGCSFFVSHRLDNVVCGYVVMMVMTYVLDMVLDGNKQSYQIMVFSLKNNEIAETVTKEVGRGATLLDGEGCYTGQQQKVLLIMVHRTDKSHVMQIIHRLDENAFISVSKTQGVYGKNFDKLKL